MADQSVNHHSLRPTRPCRESRNVQDEVAESREHVLVNDAVGVLENHPPYTQRDCPKNQGYPDTTARRGAARRPAGHDVGKPCRENYAA